MCEICANTEQHTHLMVNANRYDPTRTTTLRNLFARESNRRFDELAKQVYHVVAKEDFFGLDKPTTYQTPRYTFTTREARIREFNRWLAEQIRRGIITVSDFDQIGTAYHSSWTNKYITDTYKRGILRGNSELRKAGYKVPPIYDVMGAMSIPLHIETLGLLYIRVFSELKGITAAMEQIIARVLVQGLADGDSKVVIARKLYAAINGSGAGDLGLFDKLGRFIPAKRRAEILARTELVRAHHLANIQEYKRWGVLGVTVMAEFHTAGDERVCPICSSMDGVYYTLEEAEGLIPVHPQCFIDPQTPIYTSKGWKPIGKIKVGDLVLTHKKRFRKVYGLPRQEKQKPEVVKITFTSGKTITVTSKHPVMKSKTGKMGRWIDADKVKVGDSLMFLGNKCERCGKKTPYFRKYCSRTCLSKNITDKQWSDPNHKLIVSEKNRNSMLHQYKTGLRDKDTITKKANEKTRQMVADGSYGTWMDKAFFKRMRLVTNTEKHRKDSSERMKTNNPMSNPDIREKATLSLVKTYSENPEKRLNARMAKHRKSGKKTWIENRMANLLDKIGVDYVFQYPILRYNADFAIPSLRIVIECDGEYWHRDKRKDRIRQRRIEKEGWFVLRYTGSKINTCLDEIEDELARIVGNHKKKYIMASHVVKKVEKWVLKKERTLYNLSVLEDESYIAKGVIVHNCRCIVLPHIISRNVK